MVLSLAEKWGSDKLSSYEVEFGQCLNDIEVLDLNFNGCFYTWTNKSEEPRFVARKLDRVLANVNWMSLFGNTASGGISDHSLVIISVGTLKSFGPKPFKFYNYLLEHKGFSDWVKEGWSIQVEGFPIADSLLKERECLHAYVSISRAEESFLKQKARNQWLNLGDQNNKFFYKSLKVQNAKKTINYLWDEHATLEKEVSEDEIRDTLFHMKANKAPGPDGMLPFLDDLVSMNQSAFIPSRNISENVLLAQELVRGYHKEKWKPRFLSWIRVCITSPKFSVCINGTLVGYFEGKKGLRQGDPISPYLFVLAMEVFSRIMAAHTGGNAASLSSIKVIKAALIEFENLSGLKANPSKSSLYCSGISDRMRHILLDDLMMKEGRLQLLSSVLYSLQVYWMGIFILSKKIIRAIEQKFNRFLWNGNEEGVAKAKVSWSDLCFPKREGGVLIEQYGFRVVYDAQSNIKAKLSSVIYNEDWFWRPARSEALVDIQARLSEVCLGQFDKPVWTVSKKGVYDSAETWEALKKKNVEVVWWKLVWFPLAIPKQAFILWLAMKDRLLTGERSLKWGYKGVVQCCFCHSQLETRDHIFFECSFSSRVWKYCMIRCRVDMPPMIWDELVQLGCNKWGKNSLKCLICQLVLGSVVYNLWHTRNELRHDGVPKTEEQLLKQIFWEIRARITVKRGFPRTRENLLLCSLWNLPSAILCNVGL
ncbi:uncharacterized protein LOC132186126 [Corylus avellana]|uniref:uncharacterized protein LOC132186126 n=1 Tax=Corylus avellana TaxID=13451 RepID=UPI00286A5E1C|nr:uncharacterized protein LOC132186126 [Corylus avellana]